MEYGYAGKVQSEDKNEGFVKDTVVKPVARQNVAHQAAIDGPSMSLNAGLTALATTMTSVAEVAKQESRKDSMLRLELQSKAQQGTQVAINDIAAEKKRSPLMAGILGQTVTYRAAEAQSIQNVSTQMTNHAYEEMSKLAELSTDDAINELTKYGEDMVQTIQDPELRKLAMDNVGAMMPELAQAHYKERYALHRKKQVENNREHIVAQKDLLINRLKQVTAVDKKKAIMKTYTDSMFNQNDPLGVNDDELSKTEFRGLVLAQVDQDLANGDKTMYDLIRSMEEGDPNSLTETELDALKAGEKKYDSYQNVMADEVMSRTTIGLLAATTYADYTSTAKTARQELKTWSLDGTQSEIDQKNQLARKAQLERMLAAGEKAWIGQGVDAMRDEQAKHLNDGDAQERAVSQNQNHWNKKEHDIADNYSVTKVIMGITGRTEEEADVLKATIFSDGLTWIDRQGVEQTMSGTDVSTVIKDQLKGNIEAGSYLNDLVDNTLNAFKVGDTEDGKKWSERQKTMFNSMSALIQDNQQFKLSDMQRVRYEHMRAGFGAGEGADIVNMRVANAQKAKASGFKAQTDRKPYETQAFIRKNAIASLDGEVSDKMMPQFTAMWEDALDAALFDEDVAVSIFTGRLRDNASVLHGVLIPNGKELEEQLTYKDTSTGVTSKFGLEEVLNYASTVERKSGFNTVSLMTPTIMNMMGTDRDRDGNSWTDLSKAQVTNVEYHPGGTVVKMTSVASGVTYYMPVSELESIVKDVAIQKEHKQAVYRATYGSLIDVDDALLGK